jgi:ubiquinone/menaquinone biosynthesis C-methylase UbiE
MDDPNRDHWEQLAAVHGTGADRYYDLDKLIAGGTLMGAEESAALDRATHGQGVDGLDVMHLQCHIGCDAITMARQGATVTGVDFSPAALKRFHSLAEQCGVTVASVESDAQDLPHALDSSFDLVYTSIGALCWIGRLDSWMAGVARALRPEGTLVLVELHPLLTMVDSVDPPTLDFPYEFDGPYVFHGTGSYANPDADVSWTTVQFAHSLGEIVTAAIDAGLTIAHLEEHTSSSFNPRQPGTGMEEDGRYRYRIGQGAAGSPAYPLPVLFTLLATAA